MAGLIPFSRRGNDLINPGYADFEDMLDDFFADGWPFRRGPAGGTFKVDVQENKNEYLIEAELPGVKKDDISISLDDDRLNISVNKEENIEEKEKNYIHKERRYSSMSRSIMLTNCNSAGIKAKLNDGVLTVNVPKRNEPDNSIVIDIE